MTSLELVGGGGSCDVIESYELFAAMRRRHGFTQTEVVEMAKLSFPGARGLESHVSELSRWERGRLAAGGARAEAASAWAWAALRALIASSPSDERSGQ